MMTTIKITREVGEHKVGREIEVTRGVAEHLIDAGYAEAVATKPARKGGGASPAENPPTAG